MTSVYEQQMKDMGGIYLEDHLGVYEWAFRRDDALKVLEDWREKKISCKGGDVIVEEGGRWRYMGDNWFCQRDEFPTQDEYIEASISKAEEFIKNYTETGGARYYYVLV